MESVQPTHVIRYLPHRQINKEKWDTCLQSSNNPLIYASTLYLDAMCKQWDALVLNDYEAIMPLPWNSKWGISYIYSPFFVIAGGVFGKDISAETVVLFIQNIPRRFRYIDLDLNERNFFPEVFTQQHISYRTRQNTLLNLDISYEKIHSDYSTLAKRKIKKAAKQNLQLTTSNDVKKVIDLYKQYYHSIDKVIDKFDFTNMIALLKGSLAEQTKAYCLSFPNGEICAFYLLLYDAQNVYWLMGGSTDKGKEIGAFYYLTDKVIQDFANTKRAFRFEGSDHEGIHFFNKQFGGTTVLYPRLTINKLPPLFRYLKR